MDRRTFLAGAGLTAVSGATGVVARGMPGAAVTASRSPAAPRYGIPAAGTGEGEPVRDLPEVTSRGGLLDYQLTIAATGWRVGDRVIHVDTYNGSLPGPILRIRPGDRLRLLLRNLMRPMGIPLNALPPLCARRGTATAPGGSGGPDGTLACVPYALRNILKGATLPQLMVQTNIHTHGLQVSPDGDADNVFIEISPGEQHQYAYQIPDNQPAGLFWYHPHRHGAASHQAWNGLSGPIIVEGDIDAVPEIADMAERTLVINELWLDENGEVPTAVVIPVGGPAPFTTVPATPSVPGHMTFTINGQLRPEITIAPGETQRWRVLCANPHRAIWWHVEGHALHQIGQDGIPFAAPRTVPSIMLSPANRAEFIIKGGRPGRYRIYAPAYDQGHPGGPRPHVELATLVVTGYPRSGRIPRRLVTPPVMPDLPVARRRTFTFRMDISGRKGLGVIGYLDGKIFDPDRIDTSVQAGTVEEWTIRNDDVMQHPLHIHVNPFQITGIRGIPADDPSWYGQTDPSTWWDTFRVPPKGQFTLRTWFRPDIPGKTVYHCHFLPHEDNGMMATLLINPR